MKVSFRIVSITTDRRTPDLLQRYAAIEQARTDAALEKLWRGRVAANEFRRDLAKRVVPLIQRQAE